MIKAQPEITDQHNDFDDDDVNDVDDDDVSDSDCNQRERASDANC